MLYIINIFFIIKCSHFCIDGPAYSLGLRSARRQLPMTELYTVERILNKRKIKRGGVQVIQYQVKWLGYSEDECTWEPYKNLKYVSDMIQQYENSLANAAVEPSKNMAIRSGSSVKKPLLVYEQKKEDQQQNKQMQQQDAEGVNIYDRLNEIQLEKEDQDDDYQPKQVEIEAPSKTCKKKGRSTKSNFDLAQISAEISRKRQEWKASEQEKEKPLQKKSAQNRKKRVQFDPVNESTAPAVSKEPYLSKIREIEQRICFNPKQKPYEFKAVKPAPPTGQVTILELVRGRDNQFQFLTQQGELLSYRSRLSLLQHHPDELIRFFESKIDFQKIPKLSL